MKTFFLCAALIAALPAIADAAPTSTVTVEHPWIALPPTGAPTAAAYAVIRNSGAAPDAFVSATTPAAQAMELHAMSSAGGIMRMRRPVGGTAIASGQSLTLAPGGGYHFMLIRPKHPLRTGERVPAVLTFAKAGRVKATFIVQAAAPAVMGMR